MSCSQCRAIAPLPEYSSPRPPVYSTLPLDGEERVNFSPSSAPATPTGTFTHTAKHIRLLLLNQVSGSKRAAFGRRADIQGFVSLDRPKTARQIEIKLEGRMKADATSAPATNLTFLSKVQTLWTRQSCSDEVPTSMPFSFTLPSTFPSDGKEVPLPPSFVFDGWGLNPMRASITYSLIVVIHKTNRKLLSLSKRTSVSIPFDYHPRSHPSRPIVGGNHFLTEVKTSPDEWFQSTGTVETQMASEFRPLHVSLFLPAARVFGICDRIPYHLQLSGPLASLKRFLIGTSTTGTLPVCEKYPRMASNYILSVTILRQVVIETHGFKTFRNITLGEGKKICAVPPSAECDHIFGRLQGSDVSSVNWDGQIQIQEDIQTGGFSLPGLTVKDFMTFSASPAEPWSSPFLPFRQVVPISFTTGSWYASGEQMFGNLLSA